MDDLSTLSERINTTYEDIRAEVIVSDLLAGGVHIDDLVIRFIGQLQRARSNDIAGVKVAKKPDARTQQLELFLNRDSIYDTLPEGVFHQPSAGKGRTLSVSAMVEEYHRQQEEEEEARQFFAPFENELFLQKSFIETEEYKQLYYIQQSRLSDSVLKKIGIPPGLPQQFTSRLLRMLPFISNITGNAGRTEKVFTLLLGNPVSIESDWFASAEESEDASFLGQTTLSSDMVTGNRVIPNHSLMRLNVGPLSKEEFLIYKDDGWKATALQALMNFLVPVEWDVRTHLQIQQEEAANFTLNALDTDARLGYTTSLHQVA
jgi:hypothetical protein